MNDHPVQGTEPQGKTRGLFFDFQQQWTALLGGCNWYDFTLMHLGGEWAAYTGRWELTVCLMGFGVTVTYVYDDSFNKSMMSQKDLIIAEIEGRTGCKVEDPLGALNNIEKRS